MIRILLAAIVLNQIATIHLQTRLTRTDKSLNDLTTVTQELFTALVELLPPPPEGVYE